MISQRVSRAKANNRSTQSCVKMDDLLIGAKAFAHWILIRQKSAVKNFSLKFRQLFRNTLALHRYQSKEYYLPYALLVTILIILLRIRQEAHGKLPTLQIAYRRTGVPETPVWFFNP